jgi:Protein of unknown function (DUF1676)
MRLFLVLSCVIAAAVAASVPEGDTVGFVYRLWDDCNNKADMDLSSCLKMKLATAVDRAARMNDLSVFEGVTFVRTAPVESASATTEEAVEASLPRSSDARDETLSAMILERAAHFFQTHSLSVKVPEFAERSLAAGDGKCPKKIPPKFKNHNFFYFVAKKLILS